METLTPAEINGRVLVALAVVLAVGRAAGWALSKLGQPRVQGEILAGILLGPSGLGLVWPEAVAYVFPTEVVGALKVLALIGLVLFMFLVGQSLDLDKLRGHGRRAVVISHASIITPVVLGGLLGLWLHPRLGDGVDRLGFVLFMGAAMAITAFPVLARILQETGLADTEVGTLTITCAAVDDVTAWCLLAVVVATVDSSDFGGAGRAIGLSLVFLATMLWIVKPLLGRVKSVPVWLAICLALVGAWTTEQIGIHAIFGAHEHPGPHRAGHPQRRSRAGGHHHDRLHDHGPDGDHDHLHGDTIAGGDPACRPAREGVDVGITDDDDCRPGLIGLRARVGLRRGP